MMFNGLSQKCSRWLAGFILACLTVAVLGPLSAGLKARPTLGRIEHRVKPYPKMAAKTGKRFDDAQKAEKQTVARTPVEPAASPTREPVASVNRQTVDVYLLARIIHAEARGESLEGQVAIGAVLLNRLRDPRFPKSLQQIIFKPGEFCTVRDGQVWLTPNDEAIRAAKLALAGWDPSGGALYFYNPAKTTSHWIWSRPVTNRIGHHIFAA